MKTAADRLAILLGIVLPGLLALIYVHRFGVNLPIHDEWDFMPTVDVFYRGGDWWSMVVEHYGEHRIVLPRLTILFLGRLTHLNVKVEEYLTVLLMIAGTAVCWRLLVRTGGPRWAIVPVGWIYLSTAQFENLLVGWQLQIPMMNFFALCAIDLLVGEERWRPGAAAACAVAATFSFANGMAIWAAALPLVVLRRSADRGRSVAVWSSAAVATAVAYRWGYRGFDRPPHGYLLAVIRSPWNAVKMSVALAGNNFGEGTIPHMLAAGVVVLLLSALAALVLLRLHRLDRDDVPWLSLWLFSAASIFAVTLGRSFVWEQMTTPSRFLTVVIFIPVSLAVLLGRAGEALWTSDRGSRASVMAAAILLAALAWRQEWVSAHLGWQIGAANRDLKLRALPCLLDYRAAPGECLTLLFVADGELVRRRAAILEHWRLGPFADASPAGGAVTSASVSQPRLVASMKGTLDFVGYRAGAPGLSPAGHQDTASVEGWALTSGLEAPGAIIVAVDGRWVAATNRLFRRADVETFFGQQVPACGFVVQLPVASLAPGEHRVDVLALPPGADRPLPVPGERLLQVEGEQPRVAATAPVAP